MSAITKWRCDVCGKEAEKVDQIDRSQIFALSAVKPPKDWRNKGGADICSLGCLAVWHDGEAERIRRLQASGNPAVKE